ncbi:hypothetical protein GFC29_3139 [Anoxybacillus sp. B7M1]|uniref:hypothetical protein n=1 Tax=unclassified Anoxybacillus TaxID=2639704 RepID=UPI0005CD8E68|nr:MULTISPECIES: hypothetical protein [unclassified Anoxybacillus]ANB58359.1 hypothetical protein GFC28_2297 [Anoxybacillus sp. B2M1]ANB65226.1 hypothetical protein GFC29_3139 [Anoxybacillus sp. B7M1]
MGISKLKNESNGSVFNYSLYPKKFTIYSPAQYINSTLTEVVRLEGEGFVEFLIAGFSGYSSGGTNTCGIKVTLDGNVIIDTSYSGTNTGIRYNGFYDRNKVKPYNSDFYIGYGYRLISSTETNETPIFSALQQGVRMVSILPEDPFPINTIDKIKVLDVPLIFKTSVIIEMRKSGYFSYGSALISGGIK